MEEYFQEAGYITTPCQKCYHTMAIDPLGYNKNDTCTNCKGKWDQISLNRWFYKKNYRYRPIPNFIRTDELKNKNINKKWNERHVDLVLEQCPHISRKEAITFLIANSGDIVNAIMQASI